MFDFQRDEKKYFAPGLSQLAEESIDILEPQDILYRIDSILNLLHHATYYSIFAPIHSLCSLLIFCMCSYYGDNQCIGTCPEHSRCDKGVCVCNHDQGYRVCHRHHPQYHQHRRHSNYDGQ